MPWKWYDSQVIDIVDIAPQTKQFTLEIQGEETFEFIPGQFITVDLPIHDKRTKRWRSYSLVNAPDDSLRIDLCIVYLEGGLASEYFFSEVQLGTAIKFKGPSGGFVLPDDLDQDLVMVCTGTGIAPFRSMLLDLQRKKSFTRPIHLIFGTRTVDGILYRKELEALSEEEPLFEYSIALSRDETWPGYQGYVHQIYEELYKVPSADRLFYLCGWSMMVDEAVAKLMMDFGYQRSQIRYELYG